MHQGDDRIDRTLQRIGAPSAIVFASLMNGISAQQNGATQSELERRVERLEAERAQTSSPLIAGWDDGFVLRSADGDHELRLHGLLQAIGAGHDSDAMRVDNFDLSRMRIVFEGRLDRHYVFAVESEFQSDGSELAEAWLGFEADEGRDRVMFGRMKEPFSLEEMMPRRHIDFVFFSALNQFVPAEDHGITWMGRNRAGTLEYGLAAYNGTGDDDLNDDKDVAARCVWLPWTDSAATEVPRDVLQFGLAATIGRADASLDGETVENEAKQEVFAFEPGFELDGRRTRLGFEAAWIHGPLAVYGEVMRIEQELATAGARDDAAIDGFWIATSWVMTGETKSWRGVKPSEPMFGGHAGRGAWQLAARFSQVDFDRAFVDLGAVQVADFPERISSIDLGVNWYMTDHAKVRAHVVHSIYDEPVDIGGHSIDHETTLLVQYQLNF